MRFALVFPRPKAIVRRRPWVGYLPYAIGLVVLPGFIFTNGLVGWIWIFIAIIATIAILVHNAFTMRDTVSQAQLRWALGGMLLGLGMLLASYPIQLTGGSELAIVASTLAIAALFSRLRRRIQNLIDKRFYRRKYDAAKVLAAFGVTVRDETDLDALTAAMLRVVDETV